MTVTVDEYQRIVAECAANTEAFRHYDYITCGLIGETGEVAEEIRRVIRDDGGIMTDARARRIVEEVGDVLWHVAALGHLNGVPLSVCGETEFHVLDMLYSDERWSLASCVRFLSLHVSKCAIDRQYETRVAQIIACLAMIARHAKSNLGHAATMNVTKIRAIYLRSQGHGPARFDQSVLHDEVSP